MFLLPAFYFLPCSCSASCSCFLLPASCFLIPACRFLRLLLLLAHAACFLFPLPASAPALLPAPAPAPVFSYRVYLSNLRLVSASARNLELECKSFPVNNSTFSTRSEDPNADLSFGSCNWCFAIPTPGKNVDHRKGFVTSSGASPQISACGFASIRKSHGHERKRWLHRALWTSLCKTREVRTHEWHPRLAAELVSVDGTGFRSRPELGVALSHRTILCAMVW